MTVDGNLFNKVKFLSSEPTMVSWGKGDNVNVERYETSAALAARRTRAGRTPSSPRPRRSRTCGQDKAAHASVAVPIPSDVADGQWPRRRRPADRRPVSQPAQGLSRADA